MRRHLAWAAPCALALLCGCLTEGIGGNAAAPPPHLLSCLDCLHVLNPAYSGDDQSLEEYQASKPKRPDEKRRYLYVQPIGALDQREEAMVRVTARYLSIYYNLPVRMQEAKPLAALPAAARKPDPATGVAKLHVGTVLNELLLRDLPADAAARLGVTAADLEVPDGRDLTSIYGMAYTRFRVAVCSLHRLLPAGGGAAEEALAQKRLLKIAAHETGHALSLPHCSRWECNMNARKSLLDVDAKPIFLCPVCLEKICWACEDDPARRYRKLYLFFQEQGFSREAEFCLKSIRALEAATAAKENAHAVR